MKKKKSFLCLNILNPLHLDADTMYTWIGIKARHFLVLAIIVNCCDILVADSSSSWRGGRNIINRFQAQKIYTRPYDRNGRSISAIAQNDVFSSIGGVSSNGEIKPSETLRRPILSKQNNKEGHPYLDEEGNICQDKMEVMQHVEYDTQIRCEVKMKKHCDYHFDKNEKDRVDNKDNQGNEGEHGNEENSDKSRKQVCHTMTMKKCETTYRPQMAKVKVRVCPNDINLDKKSAEKMQNSVVIDVRPTPMPKFVRQKKCVNGKRAMCVTKYETMCTNKEVTHEMMEDYPRCRVEMMKKCSNKSQGAKHFFFSTKRNDDCIKVPAMRCRIEKRKVIKRKPETTCKRMPRQFCRNEDCKDTHKTSTAMILDEELCYYRIQMVNEIVPQKKCKYVPKRMCHTRTTSSNNKDTSSISPLGTSVPKELVEELEKGFKTNARDHQQKQEDSALPEHLKNFKEFHSLPPPSSSKFIVLNRRIKRSSRNKSKCIMVPEEKCKNMRVNPKPVFKEMKRKVCRKPRLDVSAYDRQIVRRLQMWAKSISQEDDGENANLSADNKSFSESISKNKLTSSFKNDIDFQP